MRRVGVDEATLRSARTKEILQVIDQRLPVLERLEKGNKLRLGRLNVEAGKIGQLLGKGHPFQLVVAGVREKEKDQGSSCSTRTNFGRAEIIYLCVGGKPS